MYESDLLKLLKEIIELLKNELNNKEKVSEMITKLERAVSVLEMWKDW